MRNQNLNRDFTKLDTEGVRALISVINQWKPVLYLDLHVTDGTLSGDKVADVKAC